MSLTISQDVDHLSFYQNGLQLGITQQPDTYRPLGKSKSPAFCLTALEASSPFSFGDDLKPCQGITNRLFVSLKCPWNSQIEL